jgi:hypothetical protein
LDASDVRDSDRAMRGFLLPVPILMTLAPFFLRDWAFGPVAADLSFFVQAPLMLMRETFVFALGGIGVVWLVAESIGRPRGLRDPFGVVARGWLLVYSVAVLRWAVTRPGSHAAVYPLIIASAVGMLYAVWACIPRARQDKVRAQAGDR